MLATYMSPRIVLVVEDENIIRTDISEQFRDIGWAVIEAGTSDEALEIIASSAKIDILFTDIDLKNATSGWDIADAFRVNRPRSGVIYTPGVSRSRERVVRDGQFVSKPYQVNEVFDACRMVM